MSKRLTSREKLRRMIRPTHTHTAEEVARAAGVSKAAVYNWIKDVTPDEKYRRKLEKAFGLSAEDW